jgi:hypothetical protein
MVKPKKTSPQPDIEGLVREIGTIDVPNAVLVEQFLTQLGLFHIYTLERTLMNLDPRTRKAALKKVEQYLPQLLDPDETQRKEAIHALELLFEPIGMLDEDA